MIKSGLLKLIILIFLLSQSNLVFAKDFCSDANIVACWKMKSDVGAGPIQDDSASNIDLNLRGDGQPNYEATAPAAGYDNGAYDFDGTDDDAISSSTINLTGTEVITLVAWFNWDAFDDNDDLMWESSTNYNNNQGAVINDTNASGSIFQLGISHNTSNRRRESIAQLSDDTWYHLAVVYDASTSNGDIKIYINGVAQATDIDEDDLGATTNFGNFTWYFMSRGGTSLFGNGKLTELAIFSDELTESEINEIIDYGLAGTFNSSARRIMTVM